METYTLEKGCKSGKEGTCKLGKGCKWGKEGTCKQGKGCKWGKEGTCKQGKEGRRKEENRRLGNQEEEGSLAERAVWELGAGPASADDPCQISPGRSSHRPEAWPM